MSVKKVGYYHTIVKLCWAVIISSILMSCAHKPISAVERSLLVTPKALIDYNVHFDSAINAGTYNKTGYLAGGTDLDYVYDDTDNEEAPLYISNTISLDLSTVAAKESYDLLKAGMLKGEKEDFKFALQDDADDFQYGDQSVSYLIQDEEGDTYGHFFLSRKDKHVFFFVISGFHFENQQKLRTFLLPKLRRLTEYANSN